MKKHLNARKMKILHEKSNYQKKRLVRKVIVFMQNNSFRAKQKKQVYHDK
jgi:hypothetical protein